MHLLVEQQRINNLQHWRVVKGKIHRQFRFNDFIQAFGFMTQVAMVAEKMNHHPEWSNVYQTVVVDLITHSTSDITHLDIELAIKMDTIFHQIHHQG